MFEQKDDRLIESVNKLVYFKGVCRAAPATPGLLKTFVIQGKSHPRKE